MPDILTDEKQKNYGGPSPLPLEQVDLVEEYCRTHETINTIGALNLIATLRHYKAENERLNVREPVKWFAVEMERTLISNDHKGGWEQCDPCWLFDRLREEITELAIELHRSCGCREADCPHVLMTTWDLANKKQVIREATDVANFAMMIADIARQALATEGGSTNGTNNYNG